MTDTIKLRLTIPSDLPLAKYLSSMTGSAMRHELIRLASNGLAFDGRPPLPHGPTHIDIPANEVEQNPHPSPSESISVSSSDEPTETGNDSFVDFGDGLSDYIG